MQFEILTCLYVIWNEDSCIESFSLDTWLCAYTQYDIRSLKR